MKGPVALFLFLSLSYSFEGTNGQCINEVKLEPRPHTVSILEFGAVGDGKTSNTIAFQNAIFYVKSFADKGGAQLYVPPGKWLTGSFNLTSHLTMFLEGDAIILGSQDYDHWEIMEPLPSYGRGIELPGGGYRSLINGQNLNDVVITGNNGTIDGQGSVWWEQFSSHSLNYTRPHLLEFIGCSDITVSNLTFVNPPAWNIHPVYCSYVKLQNLTVHAPPDSPYTSGIVPDSSEYVCIENSNISMGYDSIALKSGWDEYGIAYGKPTTNVHIRSVSLCASSGSALAFGNEMSGGISNILVEDLHVQDSFIGIKLETTRGRGGYIEDVFVSNIKLENVHLAIGAFGQSGTHPDESFDPYALPIVNGITFRDMVGENVTMAGNFSGILESPFTSICLSNITLSMISDLSSPWTCSNVFGLSQGVSPEPCPNLNTPFPNYSSACLSHLYPFNHAAVL